MATHPARDDADPPSALPRGTRLGEFELLHVLGIGGFGIVYLAFDHALEREVAVKEYMPASLAGRTETLHVSLRSQSDADTFALGLKSFVNEAKLLARFDHPSLVKVYRFWEANGTAYMAMPVYRGHTVKAVRQAMQMPPDEAWLRALLGPLLGAIERLHSEGVYHRDIAPDNIQIEADGRPVLLDFGAARRVITDKSQALTAILKPAYAPIEQYAEAGSVRQGPWTDLYALGATMHFLLLGRPPSPATARAVHDDLQPLATQALPGCSADFLHVIDWMLAPRPTDRPQSVAALREVLDGRVAPPARRAVPVAPPADWERTQVMPAQAAAKPAIDEGTVIVPPRRTSPAPAQAAAAPPAAAEAKPKAAAPAAPRSRMLWPVLLGTGVVAAAAAVGFWPRTAQVPVAVPSAASPASVAVTAPSPPSAPLVSAPATPLSPPAVAVTLPPAPEPARATPKPTPVLPPVATTAPDRAPRPVLVAPTNPTPAQVAPQVPSPALRPEWTAGSAAVAPAPAPVPASTPLPKPSAVAAPAPATAPVLAGPTERCGARVLLAQWLCIQRECGKAELRNHAECVKWRADQDKSANPNR